MGGETREYKGEIQYSMYICGTSYIYTYMKDIIHRYKYMYKTNWGGLKEDISKLQACIHTHHMYLQHIHVCTHKDS